MDYTAAQQYILEKLERELSPDLLYHDVQHTRRVLASLHMYIKEEGVDENHAKLLLVAGSYHDAGFLFRYNHNEPVAIQMIEEDLPRFGFTAQQIDFISEVIYSTQSDVAPRNKYEEIMNDADHDYFGTDGYYEIAGRLRKEMELFGKKYTDIQWAEKQYNYLLNVHRFYTDTAIKLRREKKYLIIRELKHKILQ
ncbi:MAG: hypothetical protein ACK4K0_03045 [Flavobacteriales bacterium]